MASAGDDRPAGANGDGCGDGGRLIVVTSRVPQQGGAADIFSYSFFPSVEEAVGGAGEVLWVGHGAGPAGCGAYGIDDFSTRNIRYVPVPLPEDVRAQSSVFSNSILWPIFHGHAIEDFPEASYEPYFRCAEIFRDTLVALCRPGDTVWIHNYQLLLLPKLLREAPQLARGVRIGFFLHVPFPSGEVYRVLPWKRQLLEGILGADLIGFHTHDYSAHFVQTVTRVLGIDHSVTKVAFDSRVVHIGVFPIGPNMTRIHSAMDPAARDSLYHRKKAELEDTLKGKKVIISVERMDFTQGIPQKLLAVERMFEEDSSLVGKVVLVQIAIPIPSRSALESYQQLRREVEVLVGRINARFTDDYGQTSVYYKYGCVSHAELVALYSVADVWLNTSVRDGMNLLCQEYVACQRKRKGTLILSEFTGAARILCDAIRVNPWNVAQTAAALQHSLTMGGEERADRHRGLYGYVSRHTAATWGAAFLAALRATAREQAREEQSRRDIISCFRRLDHAHRLLVVSAEGLDGDVALKAQLNTLAAQENTTVVVFDSRGTGFVDRACAGLDNAYLLAGYGYFIKPPKERERDPAHTATPATDNDEPGGSPSSGGLGFGALLDTTGSYDPAPEWSTFTTMDMPPQSLEKVKSVLSRFADVTPGCVLDRPSPHLLRWTWRDCNAAALGHASQCYQLLKTTAYAGGFSVTLGAIEPQTIEIFPQGLIQTTFANLSARLPPFGCAVFMGVHPPEAWARQNNVFVFDTSSDGVAAVCSSFAPTQTDGERAAIVRRRTTLLADLSSPRGADDKTPA